MDKRVADGLGRHRATPLDPRPWRCTTALTVHHPRWGVNALIARWPSGMPASSAAGDGRAAFAFATHQAVPVNVSAPFTSGTR